jgi:predicted phage tail protein
VTLGLDTSSTAISFRMAINPANNGVRLTRVSDQFPSYQTAKVYIDGIFAGTWMEPWNNPDSRWLNDVFEIPGNLAAGKQAINVLLVPLTGPTGTSAWTAAHYEVTSEVAPFTDTQNPGPITGLAATGSVNSINVSWEPDTDGIGVVSYQVYGSMNRSVPVNSSTLVGQPPVPGFQHSGLGPGQQWYYRVRAVDGNGHLGPISGVVSARTGP